MGSISWVGLVSTCIISFERYVVIGVVISGIAVWLALIGVSLDLRVVLTKGLET